MVWLGSRRLLGATVGGGVVADGPEMVSGTDLRPARASAADGSSVSGDAVSSVTEGKEAGVSVRWARGASSSTTRRASRRHRGPSRSSTRSSKATHASSADWKRSSGRLASIFSSHSAIALVDLGRDRAHRRHRLVHVAVEHRHGGVGLVERDLPGEQLPGDDAERVQVRRRSEVCAERLLGGHVGRGADRGSRDGHHGAGGRLAVRPGDAEVGDLHPAVHGHQEVLGLEVAVHDPVPLAVRQPRQDALEHSGDLRHREAADVLAQRAVGEVLHGDVGHRPVLEELVDGDDVGVVHRSRQAGLLHEALGEARVGQVEGRELLERDVSLQIPL